MKNKELNNSQLLEIIGYLSSMSRVSMPVPEALERIRKSTDSETVKQALTEALKDIEKGKGLAEALSPYTPSLFSKIVSTGEKNNNLQMMMQELAAHYEKEEWLQRKISLAFYYPVMVFLTILITCFFTAYAGGFSYISNSILSFYKDMYIPPYLLFIHKFLVLINRYNIGAVIFALFAMLIIAFIRNIKWQVSLLSLFPFVKKIYIKASILKFYNVLTLLLKMDYPLPKAFLEAKNIIANPYIKDDLEIMESGIAKGKSINEVLNNSGYFSKYSIISHQPVGDIDILKTLYWESQQLEKEVSTTSIGLTALIEPVFLIIIGLFVLSFILIFWFPFYRTVYYIQ